MKERLLLKNFLVFALLTLFLVGCSSSKKPAHNTTNVAALKKQSKESSAKVNTIRLENIKKIARGMGAQASLAKRSYQLNELLESQKRRLDHIFNFNYLMLNKNVLPPILAEGRNTLNLADDYTIRISDHDYQIIQAPKFATTAPNWRNYIWMHYKEPEQPNSSLLPQTSFERKTWNKYIKIGWEEGVTQADQIFAANLARLKRDYEGMVLYRKLLAQNMVSPPYVAQADYGVTGDGNGIHINDRVLRITSISQLRTNPKHWRPVIAQKKAAPKYSSSKMLKGKLKGYDSTRLHFSE